VSLAGASGVYAEGTESRARQCGGGDGRHRTPLDIGRQQADALAEPALVGGQELGVTVIEYALIGTLVAIAILGGALALGGELGATYDEISTQFDAASP
jgi:pilus assembly protein Flp/PilA